MDTRAAFNIGPKNTPLGAAATYTATVWGANGDCDIPTSATGVSLNVTAINPTQGSFLTLFPADAGPGYARAVLAPLAHIPLMPAGGVDERNVREWFAAGVSAVGVGSSITKAARPGGDYARVTAAARSFLAAVEAARG